MFHTAPAVTAAAAAPSALLRLSVALLNPATTTTAAAAAGVGVGGALSEAAGSLCRSTPEEEQRRRVTGEVVGIDNSLMPPVEQYMHKKRLMGAVRPLLEARLGGSLVTFGSCENGFWVNGSDIDACMVLKNARTKQICVSKLQAIKSALNRLTMAASADTAKDVARVMLIRGARVPVAKGFDSDGKNVLDISINNTVAIENSQLVAVWTDLDHRVRTLGRVIKYWAKRRQINNRSQGTFSTYTLILQLVYLLQTRQNPILPLYKDMELFATAEDESSSEGESKLESGEADSDGDSGGGKSIEEANSEGWDGMDGTLRPLPFMTSREEIFGKCPELQNNSESVGELLMEFFEFYGSERMAGGAEILCYDGSISYFEDKEGGSTEEEQPQPQQEPVLVMRCPISKKDVNPMSKAVWEVLHGEFVRARSMLLDGATLDEVCEPAEESPLTIRRKLKREQRKKKREAKAESDEGTTSKEKVGMNEPASPLPRPPPPPPAPRPPAAPLPPLPPSLTKMMHGF
ncbi:hypothetical protein FOZ63_012677 [Perkinsus olseni]|uniref:Poly(A) RNA polymerase mitochondrial-like central palm domain-containing protein n=2 Tax=Perkinsus olseni TaxID=32597 RepID=A0A7J6TIA0_PEROL|nr:hypothetical protein FOZ63_012677 [Perkinsus olseni]